ncbi:hypothetical protein M8C21_002273 [Ambrosia artemisiifolia]|uniref:Uncharacterized protein n=1 Tax=Ambrosia artemisiifolia TaxID=4212 RepID=A0AAD5CTV2_AMBAR|nr:hypothetical protein M8C21_002273 [Ambrosia artemisiifolia]
MGCNVVSHEWTAYPLHTSSPPPPASYFVSNALAGSMCIPVVARDTPQVEWCGSLFRPPMTGEMPGISGGGCFFVYHNSSSDEYDGR